MNNDNKYFQLVKFQITFKIDRVPFLNYIHNSYTLYSKTICAT